jgi:hypothetical protein
MEDREEYLFYATPPKWMDPKDEEWTGEEIVEKGAEDEQK